MQTFERECLQLPVIIPNYNITNIHQLLGRIRKSEILIIDCYSNEPIYSRQLFMDAGPLGIDQDRNIIKSHFRLIKNIGPYVIYGETKNKELSMIDSINASSDSIMHSKEKFYENESSDCDDSYLNEID